MKHLLIIFLALFVLLGQIGSLEHTYHDHETDEHCDYCLSSKSLDNLATDSATSIIHTYRQQWHDEPGSQSIRESHFGHFSIRAPPVFI